MYNIIYMEDLLDIILYNQFEKSKGNYDVSNELLLELSKKNNISVAQLYQRYNWLKSMDINPNIIHLKENHELIYKIFDEYNKMLNENSIEYYYTSGILSYLLVNKELERYHHDLDIFINMEDLEKLEKKCEEYGFSFERKLGYRSDGTKRIMLKMYYKNFKEIPITVFMYVRENDLSITQKDYFFNDDGEPCVENLYNSSEIAKLSFSDIPRVHNNIKYYSITLEALYLSKLNNRPKDIYDCNIFKKNIDETKLELLQSSFKSNKKNRIENAGQDKFYNFIFADYLKQKRLVKVHD